jgi:hypothetical protein
MVATVGAWTGVMKTIYPDSKRMEMVERQDPFAGMIQKKNDFEGDFLKVPMQCLLTQSVGSTPANALLNDRSSDFRGMFVTRTPYYGQNQFSRELLLAAKKDKGAFVNGMEKVIKDADATLAEEVFAKQIWRTPLGTRGVAADCGTAVINQIILGDQYDGAFFKVGQFLQLLDPATTLLRGAGATVEIAAVNRTATQTIITTVEANIGAAIAGAADNDLIIRRGDRLACINGFLAWIPLTDPAPGDNFFGVDRSVHPIELAGIRYASPGGTMEDIITQGLAHMHALGATHIDTLFMHSVRFAQLSRDMSALVRRDKTVTTRETNFGYAAIEFIGPNGIIKILPSWAIPFGAIACTTIDSWTYHYAGDAPTELIKDPIDNKYIRRVVGFDRFQIETATLGQLVCSSPKDNGVIIL